jgi:hypothetical protein
MNQPQPVPDDVQFTADELLVVIETLEVAMQTEGFIDTTSSGGASPAEKAELLAEMRRIWHKAGDLRSRMTAAECVDATDSTAIQVRTHMDAADEVEPSA